MSKFNLPCPHNNNKECEYCKGITAKTVGNLEGVFALPIKENLSQM